MKIKVSEATQLQLDWLVATIEGFGELRANPHRFESEGGWIMTPPRSTYGPVLLADLNYSTDWSQGGPIIEREEIAVIPDDGGWVANLRYAPDEEGPILDADGKGSTPLIAAMRCYIASKLGDELEIPEELK